MRLRRVVLGCLGALAFLALVVAATAYVWQRPPVVGGPPLGPQGGTVEQFGVKATVPPGMLAKATKLNISQPAPIDTSRAPLGAKSVIFDISFADGSQPSQERPLALEVALRGDLLPEGAAPSQALLYHKLPNNAGYRLYPFAVEGDMLRANLVHLSEWAIAFLGEDLAQELFGLQQSEPRAGSCSQSAELSAGVKVKLTAKNNDEHINACVSANGGKATLHVRNAVDYMWPFQVQNGQFSVSQGSTEQKAVAALAGLIHPKGVKEYLPSGQELTVQLGEVTRTSTVTLEANYHTWVADAVWRTVKVGVSLYFGLGSKEAEEFASLMIGSGDAFVDCITKPIERLMNKDLFTILTGIPHIVIEECGGVLEGLAKEVIGKTLDAFLPWKKVMAVGEAGWTVLTQSFKLGVTIANTFKGDVKFTVERAAPPCATLASFQQAIRKEGATVTRVSGIKCSNGWAEAITYAQPEGGQYDATANLIRYQTGEWVHVRTMNEPIFYGTPETDKLCAELPADLRKNLCARL